MVKSFKQTGHRPTPEKPLQSAFAVYKSVATDQDQSCRPESSNQSNDAIANVPSASGFMKQISNKTTFPFRRSSRKKKKKLKKNIECVQNEVVKESMKNEFFAQKPAVLAPDRSLCTSPINKKVAKQVNIPCIYGKQKPTGRFSKKQKLQYKLSDRSVELSTSRSLTGFEEDSDEILEEEPDVFDENLDPNSNRLCVKNINEMEMNEMIDDESDTSSKRSLEADDNSKASTLTKNEENSSSHHQTPTLPPLTSSAPISVRKAVSKVLKMPFPVGNSEEDGKSLFKWLIHPMSDSHFMSAIWEKKPALVRRRVPTYVSGFFNTDDFNKILHECNVQYGVNLDVTSFQNGKRETHNPEGRVYPAVVWDYFKNGCSLRVKNPQAFSKPIWRLCATLQEYFKNMVGANIYLTPPGTQGFAPHYDDIEAFVLQLEGKKHWHLYNPRSVEETLPRFSSGNFTDDQIGDQIFDAILEPGDLLYFPRGFIHQAQAVPDAHSLHITISTYQRNAWADMMEMLVPRALEKAIQEDVEFRKGMPLDFLSCMGKQNGKNMNPTRRKQILSKVSQLFQKLADYADVDENADERAKCFLHDCLPPVLSQDELSRTVQGTVVQLSKPGCPSSCQYDLKLNSKIRILRKNAIRLVKSDDGGGDYYVVHSLQNPRTYHTEELKYFAVTADCVPAIEYLIRSYPQYKLVSSMPLGSDDDKINVASDLFEKGVLMKNEKVHLIDDQV